MPDIVFLSSATVSALTAECKALLSNLTVEIIDENLMQLSAGNDKVFMGRYNGWESTPQGTPKIRRIDTDGAETVLFNGSDYVIDFPAGEVTLTTGVGTDIIRADYFYAPLNDTLLERLLSIAVKEVSVLIHRPINETNILNDYRAAVCKRLYTNVIKNLLIEARNFFAVAISDRTISKEQITAQLEAMRQSNEAELLLEINQLRNWNQTNRMQ